MEFTNTKTPVATNENIKSSPPLVNMEKRIIAFRQKVTASPKSSFYHLLKNMPPLNLPSPFCTHEINNIDDHSNPTDLASLPLMPLLFEDNNDENIELPSFLSPPTLTHLRCYRGALFDADTDKRKYNVHNTPSSDNTAPLRSYIHIENKGEEEDHKDDNQIFNNVNYISSDPRTRRIPLMPLLINHDADSSSSSPSSSSPSLPFLKRKKNILY